MVLSLVLHNIYFTPRRALRAQLGGVRDILRNIELSLGLEPGTQIIPKDPRTCISHFDLLPVTTEYICCPSCHALYPDEREDENHGETSIYTQTCSYQSTPSSNPCGASLWENIQTQGNVYRKAPIKKHLHQDLKSWVGRLLSRKGMESLVKSRPHGHSSPDVVDDIWLSKVFVGLKDSSGKPFYPGPPNEIRLVFGLSVDSFNPLGNQTAKQKVSSTGIWLVLLNLPWHLRHLQDNLYLAGVIPGKPSLDQINHYLNLVVRQLLQFWDPGVFLSRTYEHLQGMLTKAMVVPVICDKLGAHQAVGYSSPPAHYFCVLCDLDYDDIKVLDRTQWPPKSCSEARRFSTLWKNAVNDKEKVAIFQAFGWRWSPLFDLPYFDPVLFTVIDSMHALDLGLLQNHCRDIFGIDLDNIGGEGIQNDSPRTDIDQYPVLGEEDTRRLEKCEALIKENLPGMLYKLVTFNRRILYAICLRHGIKGDGYREIVGTRWVLAKNINLWVNLKSF